MYEKPQILIIELEHNGHIIIRRLATAIEKYSKIEKHNETTLQRREAEVVNVFPKTNSNKRISACNKCKFYRPTADDFSGPRCNHPRGVVIFKNFDPIRGTTKGAARENCFKLRENDSKCGHEGKWFVPATTLKDFFGTMKPDKQIGLIFLSMFMLVIIIWLMSI